MSTEVNIAGNDYYDKKIKVSPTGGDLEGAFIVCMKIY
jgi:hypothetical protein